MYVIKVYDKEEIQTKTFNLRHKLSKVKAERQTFIWEFDLHFTPSRKETV